MSASATGEQLTRLEAVTARICGGAVDDGDGVPACLKAFDELAGNQGKAYIDACGTIDETKELQGPFKAALNAMRVVIEASTVCEKPADQDFMNFLGPLCAELTRYSDARVFFLKAYNELMAHANWVCMPGGGKAMIKGIDGSCSMWYNKELKKAKGAKKDLIKAWIKAGKEYLTSMADYVNDWFKSGLMWKPKGKGEKLKAFKPGQAAKGESKDDGKKDDNERLEAIIQALTAFASRRGGGDDDEPIQQVEWDQYVKESVEPFIAACNADGIDEVGKQIAIDCKKSSRRSEIGDCKDL